MDFDLLVIGTGMAAMGAAVRVGDRTASQSRRSFSRRNTMISHSDAVLLGGYAMNESFQHRFEKFVGIDKPETMVSSAFEAAEFTASRLQWQNKEAGHPVKFDRADGFMLCLQRRELPSHPYWIEDRPEKMSTLRSGQFLLLDLRVQHASVSAGDVDCVSIFMSIDALQQFQLEHDLPASQSLRAPIGAALDDPVVRSLCEAMVPVLEGRFAASQLFVDHVALATLAHLSANYALEPGIVFRRGGLSPWQERRAKEVLLANLNGQIGLDALAAECRLSRSHFARAFKVTTGTTPLRWLHSQRIAQAKVFLLTTRLGLDEIASSCGFSDASHLVRSFAAATGTSPGSWRRERRS